MHRTKKFLVASAAAFALLPVGMSDAATHKSRASVSCISWTGGGAAHATCTVSSGQARVRADCVLAPDLYSPWVGKGTWSLWTGSCPWGIRSAIIETRY